MKTYNPNKLYINKENILYNLKQIQNKLDSNASEKVEIMPVLKAYAYGLGVKNILPIMIEFGIKRICVATVEEGIEIREIFNGDIVILSQAFIQQIPEIVEYNLTPLVSDMNFIKVFNDYNASNLNPNATKKIHIKINTGMNRVGFRFDDIDKFIEELLKFDNIEIEGIATHFSSSSSDFKFTKKQVDRFHSIVKEFKKYFSSIKYTHCSNSGGTVNLKNDGCNLVRPGIINYGFYPKFFDTLEGSERDPNFKLKPALKLETRIAAITSVKENEYIGYNKIIQAENDMTIGILPLGYADGFMYIKDGAYVLINNQKAKVLTTCMDVIMVDLTEITDVNVGDKAIFWDNENLTTDNWSEWMNSWNHRIISDLSRRIEKVII